MTSQDGTHEDNIAKAFALMSSSAVSAATCDDDSIAQYGFHIRDDLPQKPISPVSNEMEDLCENYIKLFEKSLEQLSEESVTFDILNAKKSSILTDLCGFEDKYPDIALVWEDMIETTPKSRYLILKKSAMTNFLTREQQTWQQFYQGLAILESERADESIVKSWRKKVPMGKMVLSIGDHVRIGVGELTSEEVKAIQRAEELQAQDVDKLLVQLQNEPAGTPLDRLRQKAELRKKEFNKHFVRSCGDEMFPCGRNARRIQKSHQTRSSRKIHASYSAVVFEITGHVNMDTERYRCLQARQKIGLSDDEIIEASRIEYKIKAINCNTQIDRKHPVMRRNLLFVQKGGAEDKSADGFVAPVGFDTQFRLLGEGHFRCSYDI